MREDNYLKRAKRNAKIVKALDKGETYNAVGRQFGLCGSSVADLYQRACHERATPEFRDQHQEFCLKWDRETLRKSKP